MTADDIEIRLVTAEDAGELLTLRRAAFVTEAQLANDPFIPPLTQTLKELRADLSAPGVITVGMWQRHRLVGSIRVLVEGSKATLGRFAVAPDQQGKGAGTHLLDAVAAFLPDGISEVWIFTARDSVQNIAMYTRRGYEYQHDRTAGDLTYAYLRRFLGRDPGEELEPADDGAATED